MTPREGGASEWRVSKPPDVRCRAVTCEPRRAQITEVKKQPTEEIHPVPESIQAGKGHVARANHQRHEIVAEAGDQGHAHQEDHRGPMHGEETIENIGFKERVIWDG